jgi:hypothetical protein
MYYYSDAGAKTVPRGVLLDVAVLATKTTIRVGIFISPPYWSSSLTSGRSSLLNLHPCWSAVVSLCPVSTVLIYSTCVCSDQTLDISAH